MKRTIVISAFPGVGKSNFCNTIQNTRNAPYIDPEEKQKLPVVLDCDSSDFSWLGPGARNPDFPANYISHIRKNIGKVDLIFISTHKEVLKALNESVIKFILVFPRKYLKGEYIERYKSRKSPPSFIDMMNNKWDEFIDELNDVDHTYKIVLEKNQFLQNIFYMDNIKDILDQHHN